MSVEFNIDFHKLERDIEIRLFLQRFAAEWTAQAQRLAQVRIKSQNSTYARKFTAELIPGNPPSLRVGNTSPHAIYVEEDTQAHTIGPIVPKPAGRRSFTNPSKAGALRWFDPAPTSGGVRGTPVFASRVESVTIPAHKGYDIIKDAVRAAGRELST